MSCHDYINEVNGDKSKQNTSDIDVVETSAGNDEQNDHGEGSNEMIEQSAVSNESNHPNTIQNPDAIELSSSSAKPFTVKHEKAKLPVFAGDVRQYFIFKSDFKHAVEAQYSERDTLTVLRSCLSAEPAKLIEGISSDLAAA
jgi:hypothetical protein